MEEALNEEGYVYVIWSPMYQFYGECYKIGSCMDIGKRINQYITSYPDPVEIKYISKINIKYKQLEKMIHFKLDKFRMNKRREFFKTDLNYIISVIEDIENNGFEEYERLITKTTKYTKNKYQRIEVKNKSLNILKELVNDINLLSEIRLKIDSSGDLESYTKYMMIHCLNILDILGFTSIYNKEQVIFNWEKIANYLYTNKQSIEQIFFIHTKESKSKYLYKATIEEETEREHRSSITEFINRSMLKPLLGVKIIKKYDGSTCKYYKLEVLFEGVLNQIKVKHKEWL